MSEIYLDNATITKPRDIVLSEMMPYFTDYWGAYSSLHKKGEELNDVVSDSYRTIYSALGALADDTVVFTSCSEESISQAFFSVFANSVLKDGRNQYIISPLCESSVIKCSEYLESLGCVTQKAAVNNFGQVTKEAFFDLITPRSLMVSVPLVNGLTGVVQPINDIAKLCRERGILLHLDASHAIGKLYMDFKDLGADFISFSGDRIHGPVGTGGLYIKSGTTFSPLIFGGRDQGGFRGGNLNVPGLVGMSTAIIEAMQAKDYLCTETARLRNKLEEGILNGNVNAKVLFQEAERVPHISAISFPGIYNETLLYYLNKKNVFASCGGGSFQQIFKMLISCGQRDELANSAISFALSYETTEDEIDRAVDIIINSVEELSKTILN